MTPERKAELDAIMKAVMDREIKRLVAAQSDDSISCAQAAQEITDLSEIMACLGTAYRVLSGELLDEMFGKAGTKEVKS